LPGTAYIADDEFILIVADTLQTSLSQEREKDQSTKKDSEPSTLQTSLSQEREKELN
jgi:hypothetical protein